MQTKVVRKVNRIVNIITFAIVSVFGLVMLVLALKVNSQKIPDNYIETKGTIDEIKEELSPFYDPSDGLDIEDYDHQVYITYTFNNVKYEHAEYGNYSSSMKVGDEVILYVNIDDPNDFISDPSGRFIFVIIGAVITLGGIALLGYNIIQNKKENE